MNTTNTGQMLQPPFRVRLPLLLLVIQFLLMYGFARFGSTLVENVIGMGLVPGVTTLLIVVWWLRARGVGMRERIADLGLFALAQLLIVLTQPRFGAFMLAYSIPAMTAAVVFALALGAWFSPFARRVLTLAALGLCMAGFFALRIDTVGGGLSPVVVPRWSPTAAERSEAFALPSSNQTATLPDQIGPQDWPAFRGPNRDDTVTGVRFSTDWSTPPEVRWRHPIGPGMSSFAIVGDYAFTQEQRGGEEAVTCYDLQSGALVWANSVTAQFEDSMGLGPRATPAYDRGRLYAMGATGILQCLDAATGATLWKQELGSDGGGDVPQYGFASSPLVVGDLVLVYGCGAGGKGLIAFDCVKGEEVWVAAEGTRAYSSPHLAHLAGTPQALLLNSKGLQSFDPETGALLWEHDWPYNRYPRCVQPLFVSADTIALGTTGEKGTRLVRVTKDHDAWTSEEVWTTRKLRPYFNDGVAYEGFIYGYDGDRLNCIDGATGERRWQGERYGGQIMLVTDMGALLVLSEAGEVALLDASPDAATELARYQAISGKTWNHPVVANGVLLVRNSEEVACIELPGFSTAP